MIWFNHKISTIFHHSHTSARLRVLVRNVLVVLYYAKTIIRCTLCHIVGIIGSLEISWIGSIFFCFRWDVKIRGMINPSLRLTKYE
jgi:hypothetical protein